jgi:predicted GNAT family N-acyltransferase
MIGKSKSADRIQPPGKCSPDQLDAFAELVLQGGQIRAPGLRERVGRAHWLGFHYEDDQLAAVAALKQPGVNHRDKVFRKAKTTFPAGAFVAELGWVFTREGFRGRGICRCLLKQLLEKAGQDNLFATTRTDNCSMQSLLESLGFQHVGQPFHGTNGKRLLQLWVLCRSQIGS